MLVVRCVGTSYVLHVLLSSYVWICRGLVYNIVHRLPISVYNIVVQVWRLKCRHATGNMYMGGGRW